MFQSLNSGPPENENCYSTFCNWWNSIPFGTKMILMISTFIFIFDRAQNGMVTELFVDQPILILHGQLQRLFLTHLIHGESIVFFLICILNFYYSAIELEKRIGTVVFISDLFWKSFLIQVIVNIVCIFFTPVIPTLLQYRNCGLWNIVMVYLTIRCLSMPEQYTQFLCFPFAIKNIYYPIGILILSYFLSGLPISLFAAALLGYIEHRWFSGMIMRPSKKQIEKIEFSFIVRQFRKRGDFFIFECTTLGHLTPQGGPQQHEPQQEFQQFAGKGVKIGGNVPRTNVVPINQDLEFDQGNNRISTDINSEQHEVDKQININQFEEEKL